MFATRFARLLSPLGFIAWFAASLPAQLSATQLAELDAYIAKSLREWNVAGLAIAVVHRGQTVFGKGYGVRQVGRPEPVDTTTLFAIASTTKAMTAAALAMLVDEGKVHWDDPVTKYLPDFQMYDPWVTRELSVRDLLTHRAGLPNADFLWTGGDNSPDEIVRRVRFIRPAYSLRSGFVYQNIMYLVAGKVVEAASGMPWERFVRERIFVPLEMGRTVPTQAAAESLPNRAVPHWPRGDSLLVIKNSLADGIAPAGAVWSNVADMSRWLRFLIDSGRFGGRQLLSVQTWSELFKPQVVIPTGADPSPPVRLSRPHWRTYGLGWFQQDYAGRQVDFHTGSLNGMIAILGLMREEQLGVYILGNTDHAELRHALMFYIFDLFLGLPLRDWSAELLSLYRREWARADSIARVAASRRILDTRPSLPLEQYAGTYRDSLFGRADVAFENGVLTLRISSTQRATLEHWHYDTFQARWDDWWRGTTQVSFVIGPSGSAERLEFGGQVLRRAPGRRPDRGQ
jgi:CubicO group peptidase (beta-lactamase class C family)